MNTVTTVTDVVNKESKKMRKITKDDFKENLGLIMNQLKNFSATVANFQGSDLVALTKRIKEAGMIPANTFASTYMSISKELRDNKPAFALFDITAGNICDVLAMVERNINVIFSDKFVTIFNTKLSQMAVFNVVTQAMIFANYCSYLFDGITYEIVVHDGEHELNAPRPYRYEYITKNQKFVIELLRIGSLPSGANTIIRELDALRKTGAVNIVNEQGATLTEIEDKTKQHGLLQGAATGLALIFRYFGEWKVLIKNLKYQKMVQEREWLQNHTDLLKLELSGVDPNSDEYRKAVNIINTYNEMIAKLDQQINDYLAD